MVQKHEKIDKDIATRLRRLHLAEGRNPKLFMSAYTAKNVDEKIQRKTGFPLYLIRFFVTLEEFSAFLYLKAVWGIDENLGYELETVLNSTFFHLKVEVWRCNLL